MNSLITKKPKKIIESGISKKMELSYGIEKIKLILSSDL